MGEINSEMNVCDFDLAIVAVKIAILLNSDSLGVMVAVEVSKAGSGREEAASSVDKCFQQNHFGLRGLCCQMKLGHNPS